MVITILDYFLFWRCLLLIEKLEKIYYCPLKKNPLVDDSAEEDKGKWKWGRFLVPVFNIPLQEITAPISIFP